jgi:hypothetical protein
LILLRNLHCCKILLRPPSGDEDCRVHFFEGFFITPALRE